MEERLLVKRAKRGDVDAFGELYAQIYKKLYAYALYTLKQPADAEDAVSEAVADAFAAIGQLRKEESFGSWMYRIVANKCNQRMREYYRQSGELTDELLEAAHYCDDREEFMQVRQAFLQLPEEDRRIVGLHVFFGYRTREIAEALGMNENTVRSRESRALKKMGCQLEALSPS